MSIWCWDVVQLRQTPGTFSGAPLLFKVSTGPSLPTTTSPKQPTAHHKTVLTVFPPIFQTIIRAQMMSTRRKGDTSLWWKKFTTEAKKRTAAHRFEHGTVWCEMYKYSVSRWFTHHRLSCAAWLDKVYTRLIKEVLGLHVVVGQQLVHNLQSRRSDIPLTTHKWNSTLLYKVRHHRQDCLLISSFSALTLLVGSFDP